jgi:hypothetical protein
VGGHYRKEAQAEESVNHKQIFDVGSPRRLLYAFPIRRRTQAAF